MGLFLRDVFGQARQLIMCIKLEANVGIPVLLNGIALLIGPHLLRIRAYPTDHPDRRLASRMETRDKPIRLDTPIPLHI